MYKHALDNISFIICYGLIIVLIIQCRIFFSLYLLDLEHIFWRSLHNLAHGIFFNIHRNYIQWCVFKVHKFIRLQLVNQWKTKLYYWKQKYHIRSCYWRLFTETLSTWTWSSLAGNLVLKLYFIISYQLYQ